MRESYSTECDFGGLGNYQDDETACHICPHSTECAYETEMSELVHSRRDNGRYDSWRTPRRSFGRGSGITTSDTSSGITPRRRSRRPLPSPGESAISRMVKNAGASMLSAGFHELGDFWDMHDFAPTDSRTGKVLEPPERKKE